jgi:hypothetical protein
MLIAVGCHALTPEAAGHVPDAARQPEHAYSLRPKAWHPA